MSSPEQGVIHLSAFHAEDNSMVKMQNLECANFRFFFYWIKLIGLLCSIG